MTTVPAATNDEASGSVAFDRFDILDSETGPGVRTA